MIRDGHIAIRDTCCCGAQFGITGYSVLVTPCHDAWLNAHAACRRAAASEGSEGCQ